MDEFDIKVRTFRLIFNSREDFKNQAGEISDLSVKKIACPKHSAIEVELDKFVTFARRLRLSVTSKLMQKQAMMIVFANGIENFYSSTGYIENFIRRNKIHSSVRSLGRESTALRSNYEERMAEIHPISNACSLSTIYNKDESGLFYPLCPHMSNSSSDESRATVRGTELQRHKKRISIVLLVNRYGSHHVPVWYIGHASEPRCFRGNRFGPLKKYYSFQTNTWMDSDQF